MELIDRSLSDSAQNYIIEIYRFYEQNKIIVKLSDIVKKLKVPASSATEMIQRLSSKKYLRYEPFKGFKLTKKGLNLARNLVRRHRIIERFLTDILEMEPITAHQEACKLEHNLSQEIEKKLFERLDKPEYCPHGNIIEVSDIPLEYDTIYDVDENKNAKIKQFLDETEEVLEIIYSLGLEIGNNISIIKKYENKVLIEIEGSPRPILLDKKLAEKISVKRT